MIYGYFTGYYDCFFLFFVEITGDDLDRDMAGASDPWIHMEPVEHCMAGDIGFILKEVGCGSEHPGSSWMDPVQR